MASIHERFEINVPAGRVYEVLSQPERVVGTLPGVSSIYRFADDRYRVDVGAAGRTSELDLEVTERVPARRIAWHSRDGRWTGSVDVESLGATRTLVIVEVNDREAVVGEAEGADNAAVVDAALRALKQALEAAAADGTSRSAGAHPAGDEVRVGRRTGAEGESAYRHDYEHADRDEGRPGEDRWRGSRSFFPGGDQALSMVRSLSREMDRLWEQVMRRAAGAARGGSGLTGWMPLIETCEIDDELRICAEVPGVNAEDLHVEVDPQLIIIRGERRAYAPEGTNTRSERSYGSFVRRIPLPDGLRTEGTRARLHNGVLEVRIPATRLRRGREVPIETADAERST